MKHVLMILAVLMVSTGLGIARADAEHPEQAGGNEADPSVTSCSAGKVTKTYKVHSNSKSGTTPKQNERYRIESYGDVWVLSSLQHGVEPPPDFYARGKVHFDSECKVAYLIGKAFIDGHAEHTLFLIPGADWKDLIGQIVTQGTHLHEQQQAGETGDSIILLPFTHNGQVHWGP